MTELFFLNCKLRRPENNISLEEMDFDWMNIFLINFSAFVAEIVKTYQWDEAWRMVDMFLETSLKIWKDF